MDDFDNFHLYHFDEDLSFAVWCIGFVRLLEVLLGVAELLQTRDLLLLQRDMDGSICNEISEVFWYCVSLWQRFIPWRPDPIPQIPERRSHLPDPADVSCQVINSVSGVRLFGLYEPGYACHLLLL